MADGTQGWKWGATPGKLCLVAALAVVLIVVLAMQLRCDVPVAGPDPAAAAAHGVTISAGGDQGAAAGAVQPAVSRQLASWPKASLAEVLAYDPFATPTALRVEMAKVDAESNEQAAASDPQVAERRAAEERLLEELTRDGVKAIVLDEQPGGWAMIGDRAVRVGDAVAGFHVVAIDADGVVLAKTPPQAEAPLPARDQSWQ